jgi:hypothetical protein
MSHGCLAHCLLLRNVCSGSFPTFTCLRCLSPLWILRIHSFANKGLQIFSLTLQSVSLLLVASLTLRSLLVWCNPIYPFCFCCLCYEVPDWFHAGSLVLSPIALLLHILHLNLDSALWWWMLYEVSTVYVRIQFSQHHLLKDCVPHCVILATLPKTNWPSAYRLTLVSLFCSSDCKSGFMAVPYGVPYCSLVVDFEVKYWDKPSFVIFLKIILATMSLLWFCANNWIGFSFPAGKTSVEFSWELYWICR